jgi:hypothetical protein
LGGRTLKSGQSRWFVGYKKHTFRLWLSDYHSAVLLIPLVSWLAPANVSEGGLLVPSLRYCWQQWSWCPRFVVADMGYLAAEAKRYCRQQWNVAVLTHIRSDMKLVPPFVSETQALCPQGEPLHWRGYDPGAQEHWFDVQPPAALCAYCWQGAGCGRQFAYPAEGHESLLGRVPLSTRSAQALLRGVRPWIEPAQSFEKNQLGLSQLFFNSLRFTWIMGLLADAAVLLRAHVLWHEPGHAALLRDLAPQQMTLDLE